MIISACCTGRRSSARARRSLARWRFWQQGWIDRRRHELAPRWRTAGELVGSRRSLWLSGLTIELTRRLRQRHSDGEHTTAGIDRSAATGRGDALHNGAVAQPCRATVIVPPRAYRRANLASGMTAAPAGPAPLARPAAGRPHDDHRPRQPAGASAGAGRPRARGGAAPALSGVLRGDGRHRDAGDAGEPERRGRVRRARRPSGRGRSRPTGAAQPCVVGCYRVLRQSVAQAHGGFYTAPSSISPGSPPRSAS